MLEIYETALLERRRMNVVAVFVEALLVGVKERSTLCTLCIGYSWAL
jgi:hypothetical protein